MAQEAAQPMGKRCNKCKKMDHFAVSCKSKEKYVSEVFISENHEEDQQTQLEDLLVNEVRNGGRNCWVEDVILENDNKIKFKLDTGSLVNLIPLIVYNKLNLVKNTCKNNVKLQAYGGYQINFYLHLIY